MTIVLFGFLCRDTHRSDRTEPVRKLKIHSDSELGPVGVRLLELA